MATQLDRIEKIVSKMWERLQATPEHRPDNADAPQPVQNPGQNEGGQSDALPFGLTPEDAIFLRHAQQNAYHRLAGKLAAKGRGMPDMYAALLGGTQDEINRVRNAEQRADAQDALSRWNANPEQFVEQYRSSGGRYVEPYNAWVSGLESELR